MERVVGGGQLRKLLKTVTQTPTRKESYSNRIIIMIVFAAAAA